MNYFDFEDQYFNHHNIYKKYLILKFNNRYPKELREVASYMFFHGNIDDTIIAINMLEGYLKNRSRWRKLIDGILVSIGIY